MRRPTSEMCRKALLPLLLLAGVIVLVASCSVGYYTQAVHGQLDLMARREPIKDLVEDPTTDAELRAKLTTAIEAREFASRELALPDNDSYRSYADLERSYVVWNVFATPEFSVDPKQWCFVVVGCVAYRGYFDKADARRFADKLIAKGYDVYVGPVPAYSTLGRFDDPVLNTMLHWNDVRLAAVIFHELAHQQVYFKGDSTASESFAMVVEEEGVRRWLGTLGNESAISAFRLERERSAQFAALVRDSRESLRAMYASGLDAEQMRLEKARIIDSLREDYRGLKDSWGGFGGYDRWFERDLNNAHLASVATYHELVPAWRTLLDSVNRDLEAFYSEAEKLTKLDNQSRTEWLRQLGDAEVVRSGMSTSGAN